MINKELFSYLEKEKVIDKRFVLWWQLGYEGRKIYSEKRFNDKLQSVSCWVKKDMMDEKKGLYEREFKVWNYDDVPILIKNIKILEDHSPFPCFISVKPMTHWDGGGNGWVSLRIHLKHGLPPLGVYHEPHVRGIVIEHTKDFLFWYPFGNNPRWYSGATNSVRLKDSGLYCIVDPIHPTKFYDNLIKGVWHKGRRPQKKSIMHECSEEGYHLVPYYDFNPKEKHIMIYPANAFDKSLDIPIVIRGNPDTGIPKILGAGSAFFGYGDSEKENVTFWKLGSKEKRVKKSLIERLGRL